MRTLAEREERQRALKERHEPADGDSLTIPEIARLKKVSRGTARRWFRWEPDVEVLVSPGCRKPVIRVPRHVYDRVMRRSANPAPWNRRD